MATYNVHAGHCPQGQGASGACGILQESVEDRKVKDRVISALRNAGHTVYDCTCDYGTSQNGCLNAIVSKCNAHRVDLDVSIHLNAGGGTGCEVWCYDSGTANTAQRICNNISASLGIANRGVKYTHNLYVLNSTISPALLVECAFVDNQTDANRWNADKCGDAIASGILGASVSPAPAVKKDPDGEVTSGGVKQGDTDKHGTVDYQVHTRGIGWMPWQCDGAMAGTTGQSRRVEALRIKPVGKMDVTAHIKNVGDKKFPNINKDTVIGTVGEGKRIEAIKLESSDTLYAYRVHQKNIGWSDWKLNGQVAGTTGKSLEVEAIEIKVASIAYRAHCQSIGWTGWCAEGVTAGTTGKAKRLEAIQIDPCGLDITAKAHIQGDGWKEYGKITKDTVIGTTGEKKRLECICLKGDFKYRIHLAGTGWTNWTLADGTVTEGTVGQALRIEAIQIQTV